MIKNGKIDKPITLFVTSGNFFEMMKNIEAIGNDIEKRFVGVASPTKIALFKKGNFIFGCIFWARLDSKSLEKKDRL